MRLPKGDANGDEALLPRRNKDITTLPRRAGSITPSICSGGRGISSSLGGWVDVDAFVFSTEGHEEPVLDCWQLK